MMLYFYVLTAVRIWRLAPRHDQLVVYGGGLIFYGAVGCTIALPPRTSHYEDVQQDILVGPW